MQKSLKGQVAIEYLTTYGWAILLLVIVIGVLLTMFSPTFFISEECNIDNSNFPCNAQSFNDGDNFVVVFRAINGFGYPINIDNMSINERGVDAATVQYKTSSGTFTNLPTTTPIPSGSEIEFRVEFNDDNRGVNSLANLNVEMNYQSCAREINPDCSDATIGKHKKSGRIITRVLD